MSDLKRSAKHEKYIRRILGMRACKPIGYDWPIRHDYRARIGNGRFSWLVIGVHQLIGTCVVLFGHLGEKPSAE